MTNDDVSTILRNIGYLIQIQGDDSFRARIYDRAAEAIDTLAAEVTQLAEQGTLRSIPGVGKTIEEKIIEMLETGRCKFYDDLIQEMGKEVLDLLAIRGVGVKTVGRFYREIGVKSLGELRAAIGGGKLKEMKRMGAKTIASIDEGLRFVEEQKQVRPLWRILGVAQAIFKALENCAAIKHLDFTGELRRREEMLRSIELIAACTNSEVIVEALEQVSGVDSPSVVNGSGISELQCYVTATVDGGFPVRIYPFPATEYGTGLLLTTGDDEHVAKLNQIAEARDLKPLPHSSIHSKTEADIYSELGLPFIVPELRKHADSVDAALTGTLPSLIELSDIRGDLHMHTNWSDGRQSISEMVEAAKKSGRQYIAITDHSESSRVANGLTPERLLEQIKQVRDANAETAGIQVLTGSEVDIRNDGSLDFSDDILAQLDIVVASVHAGFSMNETEMTKRVIKAIENPFVKIIGHLTGRLLGRRPGYAINLDAVISAAAEHHVVLEINASPSRLDVDADSARKAKECGVLLAINTDAHAISQLENMPFGINVARRGWLEKKNVINTYALEVLRETLCF